MQWLFSSMNTNAIDYRALAEKWLDHVVQQDGASHGCTKDLPLIEHLLKGGFTVIAFRDRSNVLHVDFLGRRSPWSKQ